MYFLFLLLNFVLFLRPGELVPGLRGAPVYQVTILACLAAAASGLSKVLDFRSIKLNPITGCVLLLLLAVPVSHFSKLTSVSIYYGRIAFEDFGKVVLYYLVAVVALDSEERIESFLRWLMLMITMVAALSVGHDRGLFTIPELASLERQEWTESGGAMEIQQLRGTGIFNDPNDLAMILTIGMVLAAHVLTSRTSGAMSMVALPALALCIFALYETKSRGGILAFLSAACVLSYARWGLARAMVVASGAVAVAAAVFAMRTGGVSTGEGTAQHRIQLWSEGLAMLKWNPIFGIGYDRYAKEVGLVAHNSFIHAFTELGLFGGTFFLGAFFAGVIALWRLWKLELEDLPTINRQRITTVAACLIGAAVAMLSLSRCYVVPTYLILALATATITLEASRLKEEASAAEEDAERVDLESDYSESDYEEPLVELPQFGAAFLYQIGRASLGFLFVTYLFVRATARWS